ncbi:MAG: TRAP transporter fused permease subunit [Candidatus Latescibacteria bacterium]|jgi:TRAP transporter 4TM/12TM fusion protein|nr:TRAP transporter fused permease subunit [Candidatus Latescibacterota bacterium]MBT4138178.1 TRAP transporter fused permease subunit [Candidatus Latescibacterota bacterium]
MPFNKLIFRVLAILLSGFILVEVNYAQLTPQSQLAIFALLGLCLVFLKYPIYSRIKENRSLLAVDFIFAGAVFFCFGYVLVQTEPMFQAYWLDGVSLGNRAGMEHGLDHFMGLVGLVLVLEATRRAIGLTLPLLALVFVLYAAYGYAMPDWLFPHRGYSWNRIVSQTFLHSQGVFGIALKVMFTYVFLFVLFGTVLEQTGATGYILNTARRLFRNSTGGSAKVAVISSGMMGSLSGSAVANTATTGTFTIPMMRSAGFKPTVAGGIEAAASSGGALVPPIMGAGAYMMLEIVEPAVTYLEIVKAALIPAILYYVAILLSVHFYAKRIGAADQDELVAERPPRAQGLVFLVAFVVLIVLLFLGYTPFRAVSVALVGVLVCSAFSVHTRVGLKSFIKALEGAAHGGVSLIAAASCVGIIIGVVTLTGIGAKLPSTLLPLAQNNLVLALLLLMVSTIILGMGLPSAVCYLLMATLVGPVLDDLGIVPLAAHLFIFYFGMMSMVTPPVALAAYTAAAIAKSGIMQTGVAAFRFALVGFALPYAFVLHPELLLLSDDWLATIGNILMTLLGILPLAASVAGFGFAPLKMWQRAVLLVAALVLFLTPSGSLRFVLQGTALVVAGFVAILDWRSRS